MKDNKKLKKKIIFFSYPNYSHEVPSFELLNNLDAEIYYYTNINNRYLNKLDNKINIIDYNYDFTSNPYINNNYHISSYDLMINFYTLALFLAKASNVLIRKLYNDVKKIKPDIIIYDSFSFWGKILANKFGLPSVSSITFYPFNKNIINGSYSNFIKKYFPRNSLSSLFINKKDKKRMLNILEDKIRKVGIKIKNIFDLFINYGDINIVYTSKEVILDDIKYKNFYFIGKKFYIDFKYLNLYKKKLNNSKIIVYITLGTVFNNNLSFYKNCIAAFKNSDIQVILSIGRKVNIKSLGKIPENFIIENFLPQKEILMFSDVFITQGGFNSINEGLSIGVPMIVIPQAMDQFTNALCIEKLKAGIYIKAGKITPLKLKRYVNKLYKNKTYKRNCIKISTNLKNDIQLKEVIKRILFLNTLKN